MYGDWSGIFWFALIGIIAVILAVFIGLPWLAYYLYTHLHIQWVN